MIYTYQYFSKGLIISLCFEISRESVSFDRSSTFQDILVCFGISNGDPARINLSLILCKELNHRILEEIFNKMNPMKKVSYTEPTNVGKKWAKQKPSCENYSKLSIFQILSYFDTKCQNNLNFKPRVKGSLQVIYK